MADLLYDEGTNYLKISDRNDNVPIPATERDFAARINDVDEDNSLDNAQSKKKQNLVYRLKSEKRQRVKYLLQYYRS
jgi:hypothetical protein